MLKNGEVKQGEIIGYSANYVEFRAGGNPLYELTAISDTRIDAGLNEAEKEAQLNRVVTLKRRINSQEQIERDYRKRMRTHLLNREFNSLETEYKNAMSQEVWSNDGTWVTDSFFRAFDRDLNRDNRGGFKQRLQIVNDWLKEKPDSLAAATAKISLLVMAAWAERGSGVSSTVTDEQRLKYKALLKQALEEANRYSEQQMPPSFYSTVLRAAKGYGLDADSRVNWASISANYYPSYTPVFVELAVSVMPKWRGSYEAATSICESASQVVDEAFSAESYYRCVLSLKKNMVDREFHKYPFDWQKIVQGFEDYIARYQETEGDLYRMAKLAALSSEKRDAQTYFEQTSIEWDHFAKSVWREPSRRQRYLDWAYTEADPEIQKAIIDAIESSRFGDALDLYRQYKGYADQINAIDLIGNSVIHSAARTGQFELLDLALQEGGNPNLFDGFGETPLITAVSNNKLKSVYVLLRYGADPTILGSGRTAAHPAADGGYLDILKALVGRAPEVLTVKTNKGHTPLHHAISSAQIETANYMLKQPQVVEYVKNDDADWPVLIYSAFYGRESIVRELVAVGASVDIRNKNGESALSVAQRQGFTSVADFLESVGAPYFPAGSLDPTKVALNLFKEGKQAVDNGNLQEARALYLKSLEVDPNSENVWWSLSMVSFWMRNYEEAVEQVDRAISINPDNAEHIYWKGRFYHSAGQPDMYIPLFREYVKRAPNTYNTVDLKTNFPQFLSTGLESRLKNNFEYRTLAGGLVVLSLIGALFYVRRCKRIKNN